jgi:hypothetical protein
MKIGRALNVWDTTSARPSNYSLGLGKRMSTVVPLPGTLEMEIFPPCASTTERAMASRARATCFAMGHEGFE